MPYSTEDVLTVVAFLRQVTLLDAMTKDGVSWFIRNDVERKGERTYTAWLDLEPGSNTLFEDRIARKDCEGFYEAVTWLTETYTTWKSKKTAGS